MYYYSTVTSESIRWMLWHDLNPSGRFFFSSLWVSCDDMQMTSIRGSFIVMIIIFVPSLMVSQSHFFYSFISPQSSTFRCDQWKSMRGITPDWISVQVPCVWAGVASQGTSYNVVISEKNSRTLIVVVEFLNNSEIDKNTKSGGER